MSCHQHFVTNMKETRGITMSSLALLPPQIKMAKSEADAQWLRLRSLQYLERYIYLILFNCYLHLEKKDSWRRSFSQWMYQVKPDSLAYFRGKNIHNIFTLSVLVRVQSHKTLKLYFQVKKNN